MDIKENFIPTTVDALAGLVATAREATESLTDSDLRQAAFELVLEHLLTNGDASRKLDSADTSETKVVSVASDSTEIADGAFADEQQRTDALAAYFKITPEQVVHIFDVETNEPELAIHSSKLAGSNSKAMKEICLLVTGARTALGQETATSHIRSVSDHYGKLDTKNFMKALGQMPEISVLGRPRSNNRVIRMKALGAEASQALAQRLISE